MTIAGSTAQNHVAFDGVRFIDVNGTLNFDTLTLDLSASNEALFDPSRITHSPNTVFVNFVDLPDLASPQRVIVLTANPVPLPGALWLLGSALGGLGLARRRAV